MLSGLGWKMANCVVLSHFFIVKRIAFMWEKRNTENLLNTSRLSQIVISIVYLLFFSYIYIYMSVTLSG